MIDYNAYVGIPYRDGGRDRAGIDCWGLLRLVYAETRSIELPSFADDHVGSRSGAELADLIAARQEAWDRVDTPDSGDGILLRVRGEEFHIGVVTRPGWMLHARRGQDSVIECYDSPSWRHRVVGFYRHTPCRQESAVTLAGCPHPLKLQRVESAMPAGSSLAAMIAAHGAALGVPADIQRTGIAYVDGQRVDYADWVACIPPAGALVEYRVVPRGGNPLRAILTIAVMVVAWYAAPLIAGAMGFTGTALTVATGVISAGINMVGGMLINAIAPIRPPQQSSGNAFGAPKPAYALAGGSNQTTPYTAIPVVLGMHRFTPPVGAVTYVEADGRHKFLRILLIWGYGPLQVSDLRIGATRIADFDDVEIAHLNGVSGEDRTAFNRLYGNDVTQTSVGVTLKKEDGWVERTVSATDATTLTVMFNFPQGLWGMSQKTGKRLSRTVTVMIEYRPVGAPTWNSPATEVLEQSVILPLLAPLSTVGHWVRPGFEIATYQWHLLSLDRFNHLVLRSGSVLTDPAQTSADAEDAGAVFGESVPVASAIGVEATPFVQKPVAATGETPLWLICRKSDGTTVSTADLRPGAATTAGVAAITGCMLTISGQVASIAAGGATRLNVDTLSWTKTTQDPFDATWKRNVPPGQYEVRVRRTNTNADLVNPSYDQIDWLYLTAYSSRRPISPRKPVAATALRVRASNQLNGTLEGITGTVRAICLDWNGSAWVSRITNNPASLYRHVLQHPGNAQPVPDDAIDLAALQHWHDFCRRHRFSYETIITGQRPLRDVLADIAAAGRASPAMPDGLWSVVIDEPKTEIRQHFTPDNSWGFEGVRAIPKLPHALRCQFLNRYKGWQPDERMVYADGYHAGNATLIEAIDFQGVTDPEHVHKLGRFHYGQAKLRPEEYSLYTDVENLISRRGDRVRVAYDVPMWGLGSGRIKSVVGDVTGLVLDEPMPMDAGVSYTVRWRTATGASASVNLVPAPADGYYTTVAFSSVVTANKPAAGDLFMFGSLGEESVDCLIKAIERSAGHTARLVLVDYAPAVFDADSEPVPAWDSQITLPPVLIQQSITRQPHITSVVSDERAMTATTSGYQANIRVGFANASRLPASVTHVEAQITPTDSDPPHWTAVPLVPRETGAVYLPAQEGDAYNVRLRYVDALGRYGPWVLAAQGHVVIGAIGAVPADVTGFELEISGNSARLSFDPATTLDVSRGGRLRVRYSPDMASPSWLHAVDLAVSIPGGAVTATVPLLPGAYLAKWVDTIGQESINAAIITTSAPSLSKFNAVADLVQQPAFAGAKVGMVYDDAVGGLKLDSNDTLDEMTALIDDWADVDSIVTAGAVGRRDGAYTFSSSLDLGAVYTSRVSAVLRTMAFRPDELVDALGSIDAVPAVDGAAILGVGAALYLRTSNDAPAAGTWSTWRKFAAGDVTARSFQFQLRAWSDDPAENVAITEASVKVDMPDRVEHAEDVVSGTGSLSVVYPTPFQVSPNLAITAQDMDTGDRYLITGKTRFGFTIAFKNSAGTGISRTFDWTARGY